MPRTSRRPEPVSRRDRPAKAPLSRGAIVSAAMDLLGRDERLTMRGMAAALDTGAASLYAYYDNVEDLYAGVLDGLLGTLNLRRGRKPWRERLIAMLTSYIEVLCARPELARTALVTRPNGANSLRLWEALLGLLHEAGVSRGDAAWAVDLLLQRATAIAAEQGVRSQSASADAEDERVAEAITDVSPRTHPHIAASADELLSGPAVARLTWGFEVLINGILSTPRTDLPRRSTDEG